MKESISARRAGVPLSHRRFLESNPSRSAGRIGLAAGLVLFAVAVVVASVTVFTVERGQTAAIVSRIERTETEAERAERLAEVARVRAEQRRVREMAVQMRQRDGRPEGD